VAAAGKADSLAHTTPAGITFTVTADGLSSIRLGRREIAKGGWRASNGEWIFKAGSGKVDAKNIAERSVEILSEKHARVRHVHKDIVAIFDYAFEGENVTIQARVENRHPTEHLAVVRFSGLTFDFSCVPTGRMPTWHVSYLRHHGIKLCYPSFQVRLGGSYAAGDGFGVGLTPLRTGLSRSLFWWDYVDWAQGKRDKVPRRHLAYLVPAPIPPGGARTFAMRMRVSTKADWRHLLAPYREHFLATFGPAQYTADHRPFVQSCVNKSIRYITPQNPYGFHDGPRRMDLQQGVNAFCDWLIPELKKTNGQGVLIWGQGGENPRGAMYRPDFDILPPEVEANWPTLLGRFRAAGLHVGVCARPGEFAYRINWKQDGTLRINPDDPAHLNMIWRRFKAMMDKGCTAFYLDSFGCSLEDVKAMRVYRKRLGPEVQTFVEHACDAVLAYSGLYTEIHYSKKARRYGLAWMDPHTWEIFRWLVPGIQCVVKSRVNLKDLPEGFESPYRYLFRNHMTPLVDDYHLRRDADELKALTAEHLEPSGQWKR